MFQHQATWAPASVHPVPSVRFGSLHPKLGHPALSVLGFHICIGRQQFLHDVLVALPGREVKWPPTSERLCVGIAKKSQHGVCMALDCMEFA